MHNNENYHNEIIKHSLYYDSNKFCSLLHEDNNCFSILSTNIQSINARFCELEAYIEELKQVNFNYSAICIQESWLKEHDDISQIKLNNYNCITHGKTCSNKAGLIIYLHKKLKYKKVEKHENWEAQLINVTGSDLSKSIK